MANRYLIASGNWSNPAIWSATSTGAGGATVPGADDKAYIGWENVDYVVTLDMDVTLSVLYLFRGGLYFGTHSMIVEGGPTSSNAGFFLSYGSAPRTLNLQSGSLEVTTNTTSSPVLQLQGLNLNFIAGTSTVTITTPGRAQARLNGQAFNNFTWNLGTGSGTATPEIALENSFAASLLSINITGTRPGVATFMAGTTVTVGSFSVNGVANARRLNLRSSSSGTRFTLAKSGLPVEVEYLNIKDSIASGGALWIAKNSADGGNNVGWVFQTFEAQGTLLFGGGATRRARARREAKGALILGGQAYAIMRRDPSALEGKSYLAKVYSPDGTYLETWGKDVISDPEFTREINTLGSTLRLELARNSDTLGQTTGPLTTEAGTTITTEDGFPLLATVESRNQVGDGSSVLHNNRVDVYVFYGSVEPLLTELGEEITTEDGEQILATTGAPNGIRIFSGFIDGVVQRFGSTETTIVELASYGYDLDQFPVTNGSGLTTVTYNSQDPSTIARSLMSQFVTDSAGYGTYTVGTTESIPLTGTTVSYTFKNQTYADAIKKTLELMPSNWFFRVGLGDNTVYFGQRQATPHHTFVKGVHFESFELAGKISESTNRVLFVGGGDPALYKNYQEAPAYRTRRTLEIYSDSRVTTDTSAQIISEGTVERKNKVQNRSTITILQKQYDIESIQLGQMVGFANFGNEVDALVLQVVGITYNPDYVILQLDALPVTVNKRLEDVKRNLIDTDAQNVPAAPS